MCIKFKTTIFLVLLSTQLLQAQVQYQGPLSSGLLAPERLRVTNGLFTHYSTGAVGSFGATDKWIGIGAPVASLYGERTQWNGQAFIKALRQNGAVKDAIIEWGNQGGEMQFRYITNPLDPVTGFIKIQSHTSAGNSYFGTTATSFTPKVGVKTTNQFGLVTETNNSYAGFFSTPQTTNGAFGAGLYARSFSNSSAITNNSNYGTISIASGFGTGTRNYGVYGIASGNCTNVNYGIYGNAPTCPGATTGTSTSWAGYFQGDLFASGNTYFASDERLKINVKEEANILDRLLRLVPVNYTFDQARYKELNLAQDLQHGLIAQRVQEVFPELVRTSRYSIPGTEGQEEKTAEFLSVDYVRIIPMLLQGLKEQQAEIDKLILLTNARTTTVGNAANNNVPSDEVVTANGSFKLKEFTLTQNTPNPFSSNTTISYAVPQKITNATVAIFDLTGNLKLQYNNIRGTNQLVINGNSLQAGMYIYSLLVDGNEVMSKKMILTK